MKLFNFKKAIVTDSTGNSTATFAKPGYDHLVCQLLHQEMPRIEIYNYENRRQVDLTNCPIFAILDCVQMAKAQELIRFIREHNPEKTTPYPSNVFGVKGGKPEEDVTYYNFQDLPIKMMRPTQSLSSIAEYERAKPRGTVETKTFPRGASLSQLTERHKIRDLSGTKINNFANLRFNRYSREIIARVVTAAVRT